MKKLVALILSVLMLLSVVGCGQQSKTDDGQSNKITWWIPLNSAVKNIATDYSGVDFYQELEKRTGVELEFIHPVIGQEVEQFNIMITSGELPDIIQYDINKYKGGARRALDDEVIIELSSMMEEYAPNLTKILKEHPEWDKQVKLDDGSYFTVPFLRGDDSLLCWSGPQIRKDLLDKAGLPIPETISEWDTTLRAFKELGVESPLCLPEDISAHGMFVSAFGINRGYYQENGQVKYGEIQPAFRDFLELYSGWYRDKLVDQEYFVQDGKTYDAKISSGRIAAFVSGAGGGMSKYTKGTQANNPEAELVAAKFPVMNKGDTPWYGYKDFSYNPVNSVMISSKCKKPEKVLSFLDYGFSEEGHMLFNFGIEGVTYEMVDGYPKYTDMIMNNPDGLSITNAMAKYTTCHGGAFVQDERYYEQYLAMPQQREALQIWKQHDDSHRMPPVSLTAEESDIIVEVSNAVDTYVAESVLKFITGQKPLSEFDAFVKDVNAMGIEKGIKAYQAALDRYNQR